MRTVAERAGVSVGNAYYYFKSKDLLLEAFYTEIHKAHVAACEPILARERSIDARLRGVLTARLEVTEPYHKFAGLMFRVAADPQSPLNPFHEAARCTREEGTALFARVLEGTRSRVPKDLAAELPELLWTYSMGIILYWIHDPSEGRQRTRALIDHSVDLVVGCIRLAGNPLMRPLRRKVLAMLREMQPT